ncbi:MAG: hypothetical protein ACO3CN_06235, partial [Candidatus Nanopelagicales bacterium]
FKVKANAAFAAAGAAAVAYAGKLLKDGVEAAIEDERAQVKLAGALRNVTGATEDQIAAVEDYILQQSLATGVADDQLRPAFERLVRSTRDVEEAQKLTNLALDIAAGTGKDVTTVANALAKANDGTVTSLKKLGISIGANAEQYQYYIRDNEKLIKLQEDAQIQMQLSGKSSDEYKKALERVADQQEVVNSYGADSIDWVGELSSEFAGAAAEGADTFEGKLARMQVTIDEAKESVGALVLDGLQPLLNWVMKLVDGWNKLNPATQNGIMIFGLAAVAIIGTVTAVVKMIAIFNTLKATYAVITAAQIGLNFAMLSNPIFLVIAAIVALIAIFVVAYHKIDWFREGVDKAFKFIKEWIVGAATAVKNAWDKVWKFFEGFLPAAVKVFKAIANAITAPFRSAFNLIADLWNNTLGKFKITIPDWVPAPLGGKEFSFPKMPKIPELAEGGIVMKPTLALIGERGPEAVMPLSRGRKYGIDPTDHRGIVINVSGALDPEAVARQIETILKRSRLR